jgi:hypothetical protein
MNFFDYQKKNNGVIGEQEKCEICGRITEVELRCVHCGNPLYREENYEY